MHDIILDIVNRFGYIGIFLIIMVENIFPPIPSEIVLTFGGFLTTYTSLHVWGVIAAATLGSIAGAIVLYVVGRVLHTERLERLIDSKLGRLLHLRKADVRRAEKWFLRRGSKAVFLCRFVPIVRSLISVPAGVAKMKMRTFLPLTALGTLIWNIVLVHLGQFAGAAWETVDHYLDIYTLIAAVLLAIIAVSIGAVFIKRRFLNERSKHKDD